MDLKDYCKEFKSERVYVHIPFCKKKCNYCSFFSVVNGNIERYKDALIKFSLFLRGNYKSIYFGGGTPSLMDVDFFKSFLSNVKGEEVTVEGNPESMKTDWISSLYDIGVNRFSVGVQSLENDILKILGRIHTKEDTTKILEYLMKNKINYSVDIIIGIDKRYSQINTLKEILNYNPPHISVYILEIKEGLPINKYVHFDERFASDEYLQVCDLLKGNGYIHYEISNFAKNEEFFSLHNLGYWKREGYIAVGSGASGFNGKIRYKLPEDIEGFISGVYAEDIPVIIEETIDNEKEIYNEKVMLSLRTYYGVECNVLKSSPCGDKTGSIMDFIENGFIVIEEGRCILTEKGYLVFNSIVSQLLC